MLLALALSASLSWVAPTSNIDGSAITTALVYNVYQGSGPIGGSCVLGGTPVLMGVTTTSVTITSGLNSGTTACFAVNAVEGGVAGAKSNTATKTFPAPTPLAPTNLTAL